MSEAHARQWQADNQRHLMAEVNRIRGIIEAYARPRRADGAAEDPAPAPAPPIAPPAAPSPSPPSALERVVRRLGLTPFERDLLLLCAGVELDGACAAAVAEAHGASRRPEVTLSLALAALPGAHWSAITPAGPLRRWRLIEVGSGSHLTTSPLRIDEKMLHALAGISYLDDRLHGWIQPMPETANLPCSHRAVADAIARHWEDGEPEVPLLIADNPEHWGPIAIAAAAARGWRLFRLSAADVPDTLAEREFLARLWEREAALNGWALLLDTDAASTMPPNARRDAQALVNTTRAALVVGLREPWDAWGRPVRRWLVHAPALEEQRALWHAAVGPLAQALDGHLDRIAAHFRFSGPAIDTVARELHGTLRHPTAAGADAVPGTANAGAQGDAETTARRAWDICRRNARLRLDDLAQRIESTATWEELVLPEGSRRALHEIVAQVRQRYRVYQTWAFGSRLGRGLGITALFAGASGTGKTLGSEVVANALGLDLYRIDLSAVVSKYIGETEKNLRRVFDAAEASGAVLLFDEADALFGKRTEVRDSHDRYANIEASYLLQRMETYQGLAILTTNLKNVLDPAFLRRIRFVVNFPFPDAAQREEIWRRVFPDPVPREGVDPGRLAQLNIAGGNIRNIALNAAFLAAEAGEPVRMRHLLAAARTEYAKLEKPLTETETTAWT